MLRVQIDSQEIDKEKTFSKENVKQEIIYKQSRNLYIVASKRGLTALEKTVDGKHNTTVIKEFIDKQLIENCLIPVYTTYKRKVLIDKDGNPRVDKDGNIIYDIDKDGNPIYEIDEDGKKVIEKVDNDLKNYLLTLLDKGLVFEREEKDSD